uniref:Myosin motor domain-containing protein n=1 Tax=Acrobeloides nanus TaxID=290746 RepID=A0A914ELL3_9BILA
MSENPRYLIHQIFSLSSQHSFDPLSKIHLFERKAGNTPNQFENTEREEKRQVTARYDEVFPAEENQRKDVDDNCGLMYLNEGTLLHNCKLRYNRKQIYTYVANILISINPYENIPNLYSSNTIRSYQGKSLGTMPPHIFAIADKAYRDMKRLHESQSVIVSGESGAGKTESQKCILRYLCESWGTTAGPIEQRILETNPILEAFGNAKTLRNNNSSRFGKFVEIHFGPKYTVAGGYVSHYLLEKSRLCHQQPGERNYHVFYQILAGADERLAQLLKIGSPDNFHYLRSGCTQFFGNNSSTSKIPAGRKSKLCLANTVVSDPMVDDYTDFQRLSKALLSIGGCVVNSGAQVSMKIAAELLGLEENELKRGLISRMMQPVQGGVKGTMILVPLKAHEAAAARDALAKAIYSRLFDQIVATINKCIPFGDSINYIGVLDIAGFEFFTINSFEQFCINYCNEKLQQFFNDRILKQEQELYAKEGLNVPRIEYTDNQDCIDLFEDKTMGLLDMLDEEARLPRPSPKHFTDEVHKQHKNHFRLETPRKSKLREHRDIRDDEGFMIRHYAGAVCYQTSLFLEKNNDALHASLEMLMETSMNSFIKSLFTQKSEISNGNSNGYSFNGSKAPKTTMNKLNVASVSNKFRSQLDVLLKKLRNTGTHFVRCIKPNSDMAPGKFEGAQILSQLKCAGMTSVLKLMQKGYPSRTMFADLYEMYKALLPPKLARLDPRLFCKCLFYALGLNDHDYKFGMTKVFFRPGKFAEFDRLMKQDKESMKQLIDKVQSWLYKMRWKKAQYGAWSVIKLKNKIIYRMENLKKIQSAVRGHLTRKRYAPKIATYHKAKFLQKRFLELPKIIEKLHDSNKPMWSKKINDFGINIQNLIMLIKKNLHSSKNEEALLCARFEIELDNLLKQLKTQIATDEKRKLQEMEAKIRAEKEREEAERREREEQDRLKEERRHLELKRQQEEEQYRKQQAKIEEEQKRMQVIQIQKEKQLEQERLDTELAKRLVVEKNSNAQMVENSPVSRPIDKSKSRYDLSSWKYADLRDTINTSNDIELLEACRQEFHRRLKQYQDWKAKNENTQQNTHQQRAPDSVYTHTQNGATHANGSTVSNTIQRYFKVPFSSTADFFSGYPIISTPQNCGLWYAHFDGNYVARQMEIHPNKAPILLVAGKDDEKMCELSLEETQLTRKKGAEILSNEFEAMWYRWGGGPYVSRSRRRM